MNSDDWFAAGLTVACILYIAYDGTRIWRNHRAHKRFVRDLNMLRAHQASVRAYQAHQRASYEVLVDWLDLINMHPDDQEAFHTFRNELADDRLIAQWTARTKAEDEKRKDESE